jgi:hypothetical protein
MSAKTMVAQDVSWIGWSDPIGTQHFDAATARVKAIGDRLDMAELLRWRAQAWLWRDAYKAIGMKRHVGLAEALVRACRTGSGQRTRVFAGGCRGSRAPSR